MENIINAIRAAFSELKRNDGQLFQCQLEDERDYVHRKLHEVCINHKLANYLEKFLFPILNYSDEPIFTDIEFNKEGISSKKLHYDGGEKGVRPDIVIHNRKSGVEKRNILVVECKKHPANAYDLSTDKSKIKAFLTDEKYKYEFGLQVLYSASSVTGTFFI